MVPSVTQYLDTAYLSALNRRIRYSGSVINHEVAEGGSLNTWHLANGFLEAFERLGRPDGYQLACVVTPRYMDSDSRMVLVKTDLPTLPEIPESLAKWENHLAFTPKPGQPPPGLPDWIEWDVHRRIEHDGTAEAYFELSMFYRWIDQLLSWGHPVWWPRYEVLRGDERSAEIIAVCDADGAPAVTVDDVRPYVTIDGDTTKVHFYAYTQYGEERLEKYTDEYVGGVGTTSRFDRVARGNNCFIV